jgi:predicted DCC family thiol-disulfide oxidoreductase YuxK
VTATLLYDADCGFCTRSARWVVPLGCDVRLEPLQSFDLASVGLSMAAALERVHLVDGARLWAGHEAVGHALLLSRRGVVRALGRAVLLPPLRPLMARIYAAVAAHRHRLPGGTAACAPSQRPTEPPLSP